MNNPLDYVPAAVPDDCILKISPSSFSNFVDKPYNWYRSVVQKLDVFEYNTSSVIGTIVHYCAEQVAKGKDVDEEAIQEYINKHEEKEDYSADVVEKSWYAMASVLINNYVLPNKSKYAEIENEYCVSLGDGIYAAGQLDVLEGSASDYVITDYKTYSSKIKPKTIPYNYKYQLLVYAWILKQLGKQVNRIRLVYVNRHIDGGLSEKTQKPLKSYPPEVTVLTESISESDLDFIESMLMLCKDTYLTGVKHPELLHVIWHDPRLVESK